LKYPSTAVDGINKGENFLSNVYLVRHGQAGTRDDYDALSNLGKEQARLLGEYFIAQQIEFAAAYSGSMVRQQQTAAEVSNAFIKAGQVFPTIVVDNRWDEFDLSRVYRELAPLLCESDAAFRKDFEEMRAEVEQARGAHGANVHRRWCPCDTRLVEEWINGSLPYTGETWAQFCERVVACKESLETGPPKANIIVFTSATPAAVLTSLALGVDEKRIRQLAGVLYNSSYTLLHQRDEQLRLFQFNAIPHLSASQLRTHR
jgi:broad specificity phosphatase PhoE